MAGVSSGGSTWKNVLIGVGTTVVAYGIIHFLFKKKPDDDEFEKKRSHTIEAFKSANDYVIKTSEKFKTVYCFSCNDQEKKAEIARELNLLSSNLQKLIENPTVDEKMRSLIELFKEQIDGERPVFEAYYDSISQLANYPEDVQQVKRAEFNQNLSAKLTHVHYRDTQEIRSYLDDINMRYQSKLALVLPDEPFETSALPRKWRIECMYWLDIKKDGSVIFITDTGAELPGKWEEEYGKLTLRLDNGEVLNYTISQISPKYMLIRFGDAENPNTACPVKD